MKLDCTKCLFPLPLDAFRIYKTGVRCRTCRKCENLLRRGRMIVKSKAKAKEKTKRAQPLHHHSPMRFNAVEARAFDNSRTKFVIENGGDPKRYKVSNAGRIPWPDRAYVPPTIREKDS